MAQAARAVGIGRQSAYRLRARLGEDGLFAKVWDQALAEVQERGAEERQARRKALLPASEHDILWIGR